MVRYFKKKPPKDKETLSDKFKRLVELRKSGILQPRKVTFESKKRGIQNYSQIGKKEHPTLPKVSELLYPKTEQPTEPTRKHTLHKKPFIKA